MSAKKRRKARHNADYRRGYEAALRKVWREFVQYTAPQNVSVASCQSWTFKAWRSWCLPHGGFR